jgi:hypothetical protein
MAVLALTKIWINLLSTGEAISAYSNRDKTQDFQLHTFDVRTYANGRRRAVSTLGEVGTIPFTLRDVSLTDKNNLRTWVGMGVQVRDTRGQKWYGAFGGVSAVEDMDISFYAVTFTLLTTTAVEGV